MSRWALLLLVPVAAVGLFAQGSRTGGFTVEQQKAIRNVVTRPDGLHQAAKIAGGSYIEVNGSTHGIVVYQNLGSLAKESDLVLVGTVVNNVCQLRTFGEDIVTEYQLQVNEGLKGPIAPGDILAVDLTGGKFTFADGTIAEIRTPALRKMLDGRRYLLYLRKYRDEEYGVDRYYVSGNAQGIFELHADGARVIPHADARIDPLAKKKDQQQGSFLAEARAAAKHQP